MCKTNRRAGGSGVGRVLRGGEGREGGGATVYNSTTGTLGFIHNFLQVYLRRYLLHIYVFATVTRQRISFCKKFGDVIQFCFLCLVIDGVVLEIVKSKCNSIRSTKWFVFTNYLVNIGVQYFLSSSSLISTHHKTRFLSKFDFSYSHLFLVIPSFPTTQILIQLSLNANVYYPCQK